MTILIIGMLVFVGVHLVPSMGGLRALLVNRLGEDKYKGLHGLTSMLGLGLIIWGSIIAPNIYVWSPLLSLADVVAVLMLLSVVLFVASTINSNIKRIVRHPQLSSVGLWAIAHLLVTGDLASIILFGGFLLFSIIAVISACVRKLWQDIGRQPISSDVKVLVIGAVIYAGIIFVHPYVFHAPALI